MPDAAFHPLVFFGAGAASELVSSMMFVPADVIRNRMQLGKNPHRATGGTIAHTTNYRSIVHGTRVILGTQVALLRPRNHDSRVDSGCFQGFRGLWVGWQSCMLQDCAFSALQFLVYEQVGTRRLLVLQRRARSERCVLVSLHMGHGPVQALASATPAFGPATWRFRHVDCRRGCWERRSFGHESPGRCDHTPHGTGWVSRARACSCVCCVLLPGLIDCRRCVRYVFYIVAAGLPPAVRFVHSVMFSTSSVGECSPLHAAPLRTPSNEHMK